MLAGRDPSDEFAELRPRIVSGSHGGRDPRPHRRPAARRHERQARSPTAACTASSRPTAAAAWASSTRRWLTRPWRRADVHAGDVDLGGSRRSRATVRSSPSMRPAPRGGAVRKGEGVGGRRAGSAIGEQYVTDATRTRPGHHGGGYPRIVRLWMCRAHEFSAGHSITRLAVAVPHRHCGPASLGRPRRPPGTPASQTPPRWLSTPTRCSSHSIWR